MQKFGAKSVLQRQGLIGISITLKVQLLRNFAWRDSASQMEGGTNKCREKS